MHKKILTASEILTAKINGSARRRLGSWIESFIESTSALESPTIFRKWAAITTIASALEQRVWLATAKGPLHPNMYTFLVAHPGVGKTQTIRKAKQYYMQIPEPRPAPTSLTGAAMIDAMKKSSRSYKVKGEEDVNYNSMFITADEIGAFMHKYDDEVVAIMSAFYDPDSYGQWRRGNDLRIQVERPQLNVLCGTTPSNLMKLMPENSWEQGFTSRIVMIFSDERIIKDDFASAGASLTPDLVHDLRSMAGLIGEFTASSAYADAVAGWRAGGEKPVVTHPKLLHYASRRRVHLFKLSVISAVDRGDVMVLLREDFDRALAWLVEAEASMSEIFMAGAGNADAKAMDEIYHYVLTHCVGGKKIPGYRIVNFAKLRIPLTSIDKVVKTMEASGMIRQAGLDKRNKNVVLYEPGAPPTSDVELT